MLVIKKNVDITRTIYLNSKKSEQFFVTKTRLLSTGGSNHTELIVAIKMPIRKKYLECRNLQEQVRKKMLLP